VLPALALGAVGLLLFFYVFSSVPLPDDIAAIASTVYDAEGEEVGGLSADANQEMVDFGEIPEHTRQAVMAAEDRGFYDHGGISMTGIARALFTNIRGGGVSQGGSTITQQYIKNVALTPEQTYTRKVQEAALALKLERAYEKDEILGFYMNSIYWGRGAIGIQSAAQVFFDTTVDQLDVNQSALLAGIIAAPEAFDPAENPGRADERRVFALGGMLEQGWIDQATHDELVEAGLPDTIDRAAIDLGPNAYYLDAVRRVLTARPEFQGGELFRGLRVHTQLNVEMQAAAQEELTRAVSEGPTDSGAIVTVDPRTGGVRALVGGPRRSRAEPQHRPRQPAPARLDLQGLHPPGLHRGRLLPRDPLPAPAQIDIEGDPDGSADPQLRWLVLRRADRLPGDRLVHEHRLLPDAGGGGPGARHRGRDARRPARGEAGRALPDRSEPAPRWPDDGHQRHAHPRGQRVHPARDGVRLRDLRGRGAARHPAPRQPGRGR
jgi:penicillin-binding protein 1A